MPTEVSISVTSTPAGARISKGDEVLGVTPALVKIPRGDASISWTLTLADHTSQTVEFVPTEARLLTATLAPIAKPEAKPESKKPASRAKRPKRTRSRARTAAPKPAPKKEKKRFNVLFDD